MFGLMPFERRQNSMSYNPFREMEEMERSRYSSMGNPFLLLPQMEAVGSM